jgi:hypothetical protein
MSSSTKGRSPMNRREIEPKQRRSSRLNRKHPGSHSKKYSTSTEAKMLKISSHIHLQKRLSGKQSTFLIKVALRSLKVMKIVGTATVKVNHHLKCPFGVH